PHHRYKTENKNVRAELRQLNMRLLTALGEAQAQIKRLQGVLGAYETLPVWQRLSMQAVGSNVATMQENCVLYEAQKHEYMHELEIVQARIDELKPQAQLDPEMRPEYEELKEEIERLGGAAKVRDVLAME